MTLSGARGRRLTCVYVPRMDACCMQLRQSHLYFRAERGARVHLFMSNAARVAYLNGTGRRRAARMRSVVNRTNRCPPSSNVLSVGSIKLDNTRATNEPETKSSSVSSSEADTREMDHREELEMDLRRTALSAAASRHENRTSVAGKPWRAGVGAARKYAGTRSLL